MAMLPQPTTMVLSMEDTDTERGLLRLSQRLRPMLSMDPTDTMPSDHTAMAMLPQPTLAMLPLPTLAMLATDLPTPMDPSMEDTDTERDLLRLSPRPRLMLSMDMDTLPTLPPMATTPTTPTLPTDHTAMAMLPTDQPTTMVPTLPSTTKKNQD